MELMWQTLLHLKICYNGDAAFAFLFHPVHGGTALMGFTDLVVDTGVEEDTFAQSGLAGVDVRHDTDVTVSDKGSRTFFYLIYT